MSEPPPIGRLVGTSMSAMQAIGNNIETIMDHGNESA